MKNIPKSQIFLENLISSNNSLFLEHVNQHPINKKRYDVCIYKAVYFNNKIATDFLINSLNINPFNNNSVCIKVALQFKLTDIISILINANNEEYLKSNEPEIYQDYLVFKFANKLNNF